MNQYERRFYEDIHKLVIIQEKILKQLEKLNEPLKEDKELKPFRYGEILTEKELEEEKNIIASYFGIKESK